jgi:hypothetical protein
MLALTVLFATIMIVIRNFAVQVQAGLHARRPLRPNTAAKRQERRSS